MRKDVKLGFAIGGVLLAVLIVYVLVVPGGGDKRLTSTTSGGDANSQTAHNSDGGGVSLEPVTPQPATKPSSVAAGTPPAAPPTNFTPPPGGTDPFEQPEAVAGNKIKEVDWSKLLNDSNAPTLMAPSGKAAATATPQSSSSGSVQTALAGSPATPDITRPGPTPIVPPAQSKTTPAPAPVEPAAPAAPADNTAEANTPPPPTSLPPAIDPPADVPPTPTADHTVANGNNSSNTALTTTTTTTDANGQQIHTVVAGETFSTISLSAYGNPNLYAAIMRANPGIDPTRLRPGMKIVIPPAPAAKPAAAPAARSHALVSGDAAQTSSSKVEAPIDPQTQYRVQAGDSLYSISKKLYGRGDRFPRIHEANKQLLGEDVNSLKTGQILTLPEPPTAK